MTLNLSPGVRQALVDTIVSYLINYYLQHNDLDTAYRLFKEYSEYLSSETRKKLDNVLKVESFINSVNQLLKIYVETVKAGQLPPSHVIKGIADNAERAVRLASELGVGLPEDAKRELLAIASDARSGVFSKVAEVIVKGYEAIRKITSIASSILNKVKKYSDLINRGDYADAYRLATSIYNDFASISRILGSLPVPPTNCKSTTCRKIATAAAKNIEEIKSMASKLADVANGISAVLSLTAIALNHVRRMQNLMKEGKPMHSDEFKNEFSGALDAVLKIKKIIGSNEALLERLAGFKPFEHFAKTLLDFARSVKKLISGVEKSMIDIASHYDFLWDILVEEYRRNGLAPPERPPRPPHVVIADKLLEIADYLEEVGDRAYRDFERAIGSIKLTGNIVHDLLELSARWQFAQLALLASIGSYTYAHLIQMIVGFPQGIATLLGKIGNAVIDAVRLQLGKAAEELREVGAMIAESFIPHGRNPAEIVGDIIAMLAFGELMGALLKPIARFVKPHVVRFARAAGERIPIKIRIGEVVGEILGDIKTKITETVENLIRRLTRKPEVVEVKLGEFRSVIERLAKPEELGRVLEEVVKKARRLGISDLLRRVEEIRRIARSDVVRGVEELARAMTASDLEELVVNAVGAANEAAAISRLVSEISRGIVRGIEVLAEKLNEIEARAVRLMSQLEKLGAAKRLLGREYETVIESVKKLLSERPYEALKKIEELYKEAMEASKTVIDFIDELRSRIEKLNPEAAKRFEKMVEPLRERFLRGEIGVEDVITGVRDALLKTLGVERISEALGELVKSVKLLSKRLSRFNAELAQRIFEEVRRGFTREGLEHIRFSIEELEKARPRVATILKIMGKKSVSILDLLEIARDLATGSKSLMNIAERLVREGRARTIAEGMRIAAEIIRGALEDLDAIIRKNARVLGEAGINVDKVLRMLEMGEKIIEAIEKRIRSPLGESLAELANVAETLGLRDVANVLREALTAESSSAVEELLSKAESLLRRAKLREFVRFVREVLKRREELPRELKPFATDIIEMARRLALGEGYGLYSIEVGNAVVRGIAIDSPELAAKIAEFARPKKLVLEVGGERYALERVVRMEPGRTIIEYKVRAPDGYWADTRIVVEVNCGALGCKTRVSRISSIDPRMQLQEAVAALEELAKVIERDTGTLSHVYVLLPEGTENVAKMLAEALRGAASEVAKRLSELIAEVVRRAPYVETILVPLEELSRRLASARIGELARILDELLKGVRIRVGGVTATLGVSGNKIVARLSKGRASIEIEFGSGGKVVVKASGPTNDLLSLLNEKIDGRKLYDIIQLLGTGGAKLRIPLPQFKPVPPPGPGSIKTFVRPPRPRFRPIPPVFEFELGGITITPALLKPKNVVVHGVIHAPKMPSFEVSVNLPSVKPSKISGTKVRVEFNIGVPSITYGGGNRRIIIPPPQLPYPVPPGFPGFGAPPTPWPTLGGITGGSLIGGPSIREILVF